jgi:glutamate 5-kinase
MVVGREALMNDVARPEVAEARRVVIKLGTRVLTHDDGSLALSRLFGVVEAVAALRRAGRDAIVVSSGAVGLGREVLGHKGPLDLREHQACAAVGQSRLMALYEHGFARLGLVAAQILLTQSTLENRARYLSIRNSLAALLRHGVVPVINQNDAVATELELAVREDDAPHIFGDNDRLAALVATKLGADLLVLLTDVQGVYDSDPRRDSSARLIAQVEDVSCLTNVGGAGSAASKGGMKSKVAAAKIGARAGCHVVIASGRQHGDLLKVCAGEEAGTWFPAQGGLNAETRWIAFGAPTLGTLRIDAGAVSALETRGASLLPAGVDVVEGEFKRGDVVELRGPLGTLIGRGRVLCSSAEARERCAANPPAKKNIIRRDQLVLERKEA